ncbi:MAG TPA: metalloregulator ArsR/SmtB family transcription factor [Lactovum miscens]|uniref:ArsR/SmtB family transcription factor n=1 Tax=Lactovum miscens TaxID=190387 RepID=UPI002ED875DF
MENVEILKTLANEHRLQILMWLKNPKSNFHNQTDVDEEKVGVCVGEIQKKLNLTQSTTSHYLSMLEKADLLVATRIGKWTFYRSNDKVISEFKEYMSKEF